MVLPKEAKLFFSIVISKSCQSCLKLPRFDPKSSRLLAAERHAALLTVFTLMQHREPIWGVIF